MRIDRREVAAIFLGGFVGAVARALLVELLAGATIAAGGYYVVEVDALPGGFGLGSADSARLFAPRRHRLGGHLHVDRARDHHLRSLSQRHRRVHDDRGLHQGHGE